MATIEEFKQQALSSGYSQQEVDDFITKKQSNAPLALDEPNNLNIKPNKFNVEVGTTPIVDIEAPKAPTIPKLQEQINPQTNPMVEQTQFSMPQQPDMPTKGGSIFGQAPTLGTQFGARQSADIYSGGVNYGTDFIVPKGTKITAPEGEWKVVQAFNGAKAEGSRNAQRGINSGYGNSVLLQNTQTGEKLRFSHLTRGGVAVKPGQVIKGGQLIGLSGATGNTDGATGQHLDLEYYNSQGRIGNVMKTPYAKYLR